MELVQFRNRNVLQFEQMGKLLVYFLKILPVVHKFNDYIHQIILSFTCSSIMCRALRIRMWFNVLAAHYI